MPPRRFTLKFGIGGPNMAQHEFDITIDADGQVHAQSKGFKGKACHDAVRLLEQIVGTVKELQYTSERYEPDEEVRFQIEQKT